MMSTRIEDDAARNVLLACLVWFFSDSHSLESLSRFLKILFLVIKSKEAKESFESLRSTATLHLYMESVILSQDFANFAHVIHPKQEVVLHGIRLLFLLYFQVKSFPVSV